ncbi:hypothetical protein BS78_07G038300 [Paspalum vaginatum]|nr:hypothetical protein BS78_07G038300 [Paspalum vaginatum]
MAGALCTPVNLGPERVTLSDELLHVLTSGDAVHFNELLSSGGQSNGHVTVNVGVGPTTATSSSCLLGVTSNGNTALHLAASRGHAELAAPICERAPTLVATRNRCLDTPLHCAAKAGSRDVAASLLARMRGAGAEEEMALSARNRAGATALYEAVRHGRAPVVDLLMAEAPEMASLPTHDGFSPLYLAASIDDPDMVRALLRPSQDGTPSPASFSGPEGRTALHVAAASTKAEEILSWEPVGPSLLTEVDSSGRTPLQYAVLYGSFHVVQLFLDGRTSEQLRIPDNHGLFPVHTAAMVGRASVIDELIKKCPDYYELVDEGGRNLLHCAVQHDKGSVVCHVCQNDKLEMLLNATDDDGNTPLHLAAKHGFPRIVSLLLQKTSVETCITNKDGLTAADLCGRAIAPRRLHYFLNPHCVVRKCLYWLRARVTLDGYHPQYVEHIESFRKKIEGNEDETSNKEDDDMINNGRHGTIASVLIATVAFAAAFTVPGGFIADDHPSAGTAIFAKRFAFRGFVVSDTMAFVCSIVATCFLIYGAKKVPRKHRLWYHALASGLVPVAVCFPGIWIPLHLGLPKAVWRRAGWRGLVNVYGRPSSLREPFYCFTRSLLFDNLRRPFFIVLISTAFIAAVALNIVLPNY